jgi:hypothetical protein
MVNLFFITFLSGNDCLCDHLLTQAVYLKGMYVSFLEWESCQKTISISNIPCEMSNNDVVNAYTHFGTVKCVTVVCDDLGIETRKCLIVIMLTEHIPHCLKI